MIERAHVAERYAARPRHVAIAMEGTESWVSERGRTQSDGHTAAARALCATVRTATHYGVEILTVHARSDAVARAFAAAEWEALRRANVRLCVFGRLDTAPEATRDAFSRVIAGTAACDGMRLNIAVNYSARTELSEAVRALALDVRSGHLELERIDDELLASYLYTRGLPDPDLLIRTGGALRLSNFLLYQIAYSELWSTPTLWPDFDARDFAAALGAFASRQRRFGS